jgi:SNF2 family DNA or RNA helicase
MHSINVSIDLTRFTYAIFAELYWQPGIVAQAAGRFDRISGHDPATVVFVVVRGRREELVAVALQKKLREQQQLMKLGGAQTALSVPIEMDAAAWQAEIANVAATGTDDVY